MSISRRLRLATIVGMEYTPPKNGPNELKAMALSGDWREQIIVLSRASVDPELIKAMMSGEPHEEIGWL